MDDAGRARKDVARSDGRQEGKALRMTGDVGREQFGELQRPPDQQAGQHHVRDGGDRVQAFGEKGDLLLHRSNRDDAGGHDHGEIPGKQALDLFGKGSSI